ncbi:helix-turn-helix domain-containing protein [Pseudaquabacterium pictum]|uniref:AraC family transcriptional regulator n=1 Tax=Pseudaquabacterium pictum TaxID=2315236 RepID=A0A480AXN6_9BURK|nr:helix-turn-helix domain-containing protein [Rubrivivax pictus]GCL65676.1 AraC family transcriptional regulator [Rubrivivax pictus]
MRVSTKTAAAMPAASPLPTSLPTYALYGEAGRTQATDWLHCERIAERSQRHDWEIRPHRHAALLQILHIHRGTAQAWLDGRTQPLAGPCVLLLPALVPHGFVFAPDIDGTVVTVLEQHLARLLAGTPALAAQLGQARLCQLDDSAPEAAALQAAVAQLRGEFGATGAWRELALDAALLQLVVQLGRLLPAQDGDGADAAPTRAGARALDHVRRLRTLVEARFRQQPGLAALAAQLGITPTQLNRVCHQVLGHSALGVLHGRLVLEAQRDLAYTTLSVKQIALGLGFADAGYFSRFFLRQTGHTPSAWRALAAR